jgi:Outer membrane protein beta-barrel domain
MRYSAILLGVVLLLSFSASAQTTASNSVLLPASYFAVPATPDLAANAPAISLTPFSVTPANTPPGGLAPSTPLSLLPAPAAPPQDVTSVFENYAWQLYGGYTFLHFYELPGITPSMNGFNYSVVYYWKDWFGVDGEFAATHATQDNVSSWFLFGGGGPRFRWSARKGVELWAHALFGYSHFTPQTPAGNQHAFAYELGGGADLPFKPRWAIRLGADAMCTNYFNTHQFSPTAHAGVVFRF